MHDGLEAMAIREYIALGPTLTIISLDFVSTLLQLRNDFAQYFVSISSYNMQSEQPNEFEGEGKMNVLAKIEMLFTKVGDREQIQSLLKVASIGLYVYLAISFGVMLLLLHNSPAQLSLAHDPYVMTPKGATSDQLAMFTRFSMVVGFVIIVGLVICVDRLKSRIAAVLIFTYFLCVLFWEAASSSLTSLFSLLGICYYVIFGWCALRATEAVFKLHVMKKASN